MTSQHPNDPFSDVPRWRPEALPPELRAGLWGPVALFGLISVTLGIVVTLWPHVTLAVVAVLLGLQLLIHGLFRVVQAAGSSGAPTAARAVVLALGLLSVLVGLLCVTRVTTTIYALAVLVGVFWVVSGFAQLFVALSSGVSGAGQGGDRELTVASGVLGIVAGLIVIAWPHESLTALTIVLGCWLIVLGVIGLGTAWRLHGS
jgi:uncharacterized membrane protein HdeD (DUF308 family)